MYNLFAEAHQAKASSHLQCTIFISSFQHFLFTVYNIQDTKVVIAINCTLFAEAHQAEASVHGKW